MNRRASGFHLPLFIVHCSLLILICTVSGHAQDRSKMPVYIPAPSVGTSDQRDYFLTNFKMELIGANYPSVDTKEESAFTLQLDISGNPAFNGELPPDDTSNPRYSLGLHLIRSADDTELVSFSFPFDSTGIMANWNLYLLYNAMANASLLPEEGSASSDAAASGDAAGDDAVNNADKTDAAGGGDTWDGLWRDKRFYLSLGAGFDLGYFLRPETMFTDQGIIAPMAVAGLEWRVFSFFSIQVDIRSHILNDSVRYIYAPGAALTLRGVIKPDHLMLEPYAGAEFTMAVLPEFNMPAPWLWALGGVQFGFKGGRRWAVSLDLAASFSALGALDLPNNHAYNMMRVSIIVGCKIGFVDRKK
jgi:hypothetical protein